MKTKINNTDQAKKLTSVRVKTEGVLFCLTSVFLLLGLIISPAAAAVEWKVSPACATVGDTLKIKGTACPRECIKAEVSFKKEIPVCKGKYQYLIKDIKIPEAKDNLFTVEAEGVKDLNVKVKKVVWFNLSSEAENGNATISQAHVPPLTYNILIDGKALEGKEYANLTVTASQTLKADSKGKFEYKYDTSSMPAGKFNITIGDTEKTVELKPKEQKKPVAVEHPKTEKIPLKVKFSSMIKGFSVSHK